MGDPHKLHITTICMWMFTGISTHVTFTSSSAMAERRCDQFFYGVGHFEAKL